MSLYDKNREKIRDFLEFHRERLLRKYSVNTENEYELEEEQEEELSYETEPDKSQRRGRRIDNVNLFLPPIIGKKWA